MTATVMFVDDDDGELRARAVRWWGMDCIACGNAHPDGESMTDEGGCELCGSIEHMRNLWIEDDEAQWPTETEDPAALALAAAIAVHVDAIADLIDQSQTRRAACGELPGGDTRVHRPQPATAPQAGSREAG
jgi:hypothetical protein